jgi:hypothetical protein
MGSNPQRKELYMLAAIAFILIVFWVIGLITHLFGAAIYIFLVLGIIFGISHFLRGNNTTSV